MHFARERRTETPVWRCMAWVSRSSMMFPVAVLIVAALTFFTRHPTAGIIGLLTVALVPWVFVAVDRPPPALLLVTIELTAIAWLVIGLDDGAALFMGVITLSWAAAEGRRMASIVCFVGTVAIALVASVLHRTAFEHNASVIWITGTAIGWFLGVLLDQQRQLTDALSEARHELSLAAIRDERTMVAREVHDIVGHSLTVVLLNISGARRQLSKNPTAAADALDRAEVIARDSLETVRTVVGLLSSEDQRLEPMPGGADIAGLLDQARRAGLPVTSSMSGDPAELEPAIGLTIVRLLQESLANASRHAPGAPVDVVITVAAHDVTAIVSNPVPRVVDGNAAPTRRGVGVASMTDRVAAVRGTLDIGRRGDRWTVRCVLPRTVHAEPHPSPA